jgi:anti-anti-sigma regulatory factor
MNLERNVYGDIHVLTPRKGLMGGDETHELSGAIQEIVAGGMPKIIIDLGKVSFLNVSCNNRQGWFRVARTTKRINNLFLITKLAFVFETFDTVEEALVGEHSPEKSNGGDK